MEVGSVSHRDAQKPRESGCSAWRPEQRHQVSVQVLWLSSCAPCEAALCASSCTVTLDIGPSAQWRRKFDNRGSCGWSSCLRHRRTPPPNCCTCDSLADELAPPVSGCFKCPLGRALDARDCVSTREEQHRQNQQHAKHMSKQRSQHTVGIARKKNLSEQSELHQRPSLHAWFFKIVGVSCAYSRKRGRLCVHGVCVVLVHVWNVGRCVGGRMRTCLSARLYV